MPLPLVLRSRCTISVTIMFPLQLLLVISIICSYGDAQELKQLQVSITKQERKTAPIQCHVSGISLDSAYIHWYRQKPGKAPERILYLSSGKPVFDRDSDKGKFEAEKISTASICTLTVRRISKDDAATYYCAYWAIGKSTYNKIFGSGTKLVVTNKQATPTAQGEMLHHVGDSKETYVCLVHNFFPNVIRMYWEDKEGKKISDNVVQGEVWPPQEDADSYSVSSWLTVNKDSNKEYICQYEREGSVKQSVHTQLPTATPTTQADNCTASQASGKENFTHRTASLIYIVLLLKSSMYYVVVLFFIYRMRSPTKDPPRKH